MDGLESLQEIILTFDCGGYHSATPGCVDGTFKEVFSVELPKIERELKVNQILKKKKVDLTFINKNLDKSVLYITKAYNAKMSHMEYPRKFLKQEEVQLIIDWLKEV